MSINLGKDIPERYEKIMSISRPEFARTIARLPWAESEETGEGRYGFRLDPGEVMIEVTAMGDHVIEGSLLALPRQRVSFEFKNMDQKTRNDFIAQFDSCFQRGGG